MKAIIENGLKGLAGKIICIYTKAVKVLPTNETKNPRSIAKWV